MWPVDSMAFTTPSGAKPNPDTPWRRWSSHGRAWCLAWWVALCLWVGGAGWAQADGASTVSLARTPDGLYLSARVPLTLTTELEEVMLRGVPLHFVWQADLRRTRWYWADQKLGSSSRVVRVAYQPLTRRWRVSQAPGPLSEQGLVNALHQNLDSLEDALVAASRITRWRVAGDADLASTNPDRLDVQFRLESGLLPRLFQIGSGAESGLSFKQTLVVPTTASPAEESGS